ncbi:hypothetical protein M8C21_007871, partial [Ambrosia artemisiifolia]
NSPRVFRDKAVGGSLWFPWAILNSHEEEKQYQQIKKKSLTILNLGLIEWAASFLLLLCALRNLKQFIRQYTQSQSLSEPLLVNELLDANTSQPEEPSLLSKLTFAWVNPLLAIGYRKPLVLEDIPSLASVDQAAVAHEKFTKAWDSLQTEKTLNNANMVPKALAKVYFKEMVVSGLCILLRSIMVVVESLSNRQFYFSARRTGMRMRSALMVKVYEKQLKLSNLGRIHHSTGEVVNYIAVDAYRMGEFPIETEVYWLRETLFKRAYGTVVYWMSPTLVSSVVFFGCVLLKSAPLDAATIFTILAALRTMSEPVRVLPDAISALIQVKVSFDRINSFLVDDELKDIRTKKIQEQENSQACIKIQDGNFSWDPESPIPTLRNINLEVKCGQKVAVCGSVGAGKSSLLYSILGEISTTSGTVSIFGSIAYVSQTSWIQSGTIQDNILYGKPMDRTKYEKAIKACALDKDIEAFSHGDLTEIGQRGLNLSGGQKQRVQLARAVYNEADIYLLDDPFSAVMQDGQITQSGNYENILKAGTAFEELVNAHKEAITDGL